MYKEMATGEEDASEFTVGGMMNKDDPMDFDGGDSGDDEDDGDEDDDGLSKRSHRGKIDKVAEEAAMEDISRVLLPTQRKGFARGISD